MELFEGVIFPGGALSAVLLLQNLGLGIRRTSYRCSAKKIDLPIPQIRDFHRDFKLTGILGFE